jgi:thioredoxin 1
MNKIFLLCSFALSIFSCTNGQTESSEYKLSAKDFADQINKNPTAAILDVRTPEEFSKGHLPSALNIDWNGNGFEEQIKSLEKTKPVYVYCLSGKRSSDAARKMRSEGFSNVYELAGGILKWRSENLPEDVSKNNSPGITIEKFRSLTNTDKLVLVDFYADWCAPCRKMKPYLDEISDEMKDKVTVLRFNADDNQELLKQLAIDELPVMQIYKSENLLWTYKGFIEKDDIKVQIDKQYNKR